MREAHNSKLKIQNCQRQQLIIQNSKLKIAAASLSHPLNSKEGTLSPRRRGPELVSFGKFINKDAETTSSPAR